MATETRPQSEDGSRTTRSNTLERSPFRRVWKSVRDVLLYSSAYLALVATAEVVVVTELLSIRWTAAPVVAGLLTFAVYGSDRITDVETDAESTPGRTAFVRRHEDLLYVLVSLSYGLAVALTVLGGPIAFGLALLPGAVWILYASDWASSVDTPFPRLKDVLLLNSALVAVAWSLVVVFLPVAFAGARVTPAVGVVFVFFVLATFVNTEVPNVRDVESDRSAGVATLPVVLGVRRTRHVLYGVVTLAAAVLAAAVAGGLASLTATGELALCLAVLSVVVCCLGRVHREGALTLAAECTRLPVLLVVALPFLGH